MNSIRASVVVLLVVVALLNITPPAGATVEAGNEARVSLGGIIVELPAPIGFRSVSMETSVTRAMSANGPRRLATYYAESDLDRLPLAEPGSAAASFSRWFMASVSRELEPVRATLQEFQEFKNILREQHEQSLRDLEPQMREFSKRVSTNMSKDFDSEITANVGEMVPLGVVAEDSRSLSTAMLMQITTRERGQETKASTVAAISATVFIRGKVLFLYTYAKLRSPKELEWAKQASQHWVAQVVKANRPAGDH